MPVANGLIKSIAAAKEAQSPLKKDLEDKLKLSQHLLPPAPVPTSQQDIKPAAKPKSKIEILLDWITEAENGGPS